MKIGGALIGFAMLTVLYVGVLIYIDRENHRRGAAAVALFALMSFVLRYARWLWLLGRRNFRISWLLGFLAYLVSCD